MDSFLSWIGGKKLLRKTITQEFPSDYKKYVEVFGGAGWVLFFEERKAHEVYNDFNSDLVNLFKCTKYHTEELQRELNFMLNSRTLFEEYMSQLQSKGLTDIQRAARYFVLIKTSYGSKGTHYGAVRKNVENLKEYLSFVQKRLSSVVIENKSYEGILDKYDSKDTLFYLDPPYYGAEKYYSADFDIKHHQHLNKLLCNVEGKFILSYNDDSYIRHLYKNFSILEIERNNNLTSRYDENRRYKEIIIKNY